MLEKDIRNKEMRYISCIKINGVPILPPLITHVKRKEMHKYKQQAIRLEKCLKREHELRQYINIYYTPNLNSSTNLLVTNTLEHQLSFQDMAPINNMKDFLKTSPSQKEEPSVIEKRASQLSCNVQSSQYTNNEFTVLTNFGKCKSDIVIIDDACQSKENCLPEDSNLENKADISNEDNQRPRLIRSNSYIIETPSPMLLEHLRKQSVSLDINTTEDIYAREIDSTDIFLLEANKVNCVCQNHESNLNGSNNTDISRSESELKNISYFSDQISNNGDATVIDSQYHLKEFIDNNVPKMVDNDIFLNKNDNESEDCSNSNVDCSYISNNVVDCPPHNSNITYLKKQLMSYDEDSLTRVLNNIPEIYSRQIVELLEKHKQERFLKINTYMNMNDSSIADNSLFDNEQTVIRNCSSQIHEPLSKLDQNLRNTGYHILPSDAALKYDNSDTTILTDRTLNNNKEIHRETILNCSRELFPNYDRSVLQQSHEDHAASIIGATAKGYLIRRLMRTDRVQGLIQTIRDALICAMQLHTENNDAINESDVELHRRLIQQVSAACLEFHDVFFSLTTADQMNIIRLDRERQKEKLKRPPSLDSSGSKLLRSSRSITFSN